MSYSKPTVTINGKQQVLARVIMARKIGRSLKTAELVHHKDENPFNNKIGNLQIVSRAEHKRIHARIGFATRIKKKWILSEEGVVGLYRERNLTCGEIARIFGCSDKTISRVLKGIPAFQYDLRKTRGLKKT